MAEICGKCKVRERVAGQRWCAQCRSEYARRGRQRRVEQVVEHPVEEVARVEQSTVEQAPSVEQVAKNTRVEERVMRRTLTVSGPVRNAVGVEVHCEVCKRPKPAEPFLPPLDARGWRILGTDPVGWKEGHGPESGLLCCKHLICYDAIPGHRRWDYFE